MDNSGMFERDLYIIPNLNIDNIRSFPLHYHRHIEFVYIVEGFMEMDIGGERCRVEKGDAVLVTSFVLHNYIKLKECKRCIVVSEPDAFGFLGSFLEKNQLKSPLIKKDRLLQIIPDVDAKLSEAYTLHRNPSPREPKTILRITEILFEMFSRICISEEIISNEHIYDSTYLSAMKYCCDNFTDENFDIKKMADTLCVSSSTLQKIFSKKVGMGVKEYINYLRVGNAKSLLASTALPVSEIALSCGFSTIRSFNRAFLKFNGFSPSKVRIQSQDEG